MLAGSVFAGDTYVQPHTRSDGTFVQGHYRTAPDNAMQNNYSTQGNVNPHTGQAGTVDPYQQQRQNQPAPQQWQQAPQPAPQQYQQYQQPVRHVEPSRRSGYSN